MTINSAKENAGKGTFRKTMSDNKTVSGKNIRADSLGRGLAELFGEIGKDSIETTSARDRILKIQPAKLAPNPNQPRRDFDQAAIEELATSIRRHGVLQPILVRQAGAELEQDYEIIAGERRWHAAQLAGLSAVPVLVQDSDARSAFEMALIENIQRSDLNNIEEAGAYRRLVLDYGYTQQNVAALLGKSRSHIANQMRLLELPDDVQDLIRTNALTPGHARQLIGRPDASRLARRIVQKNLTVRDVETMMAQARPSGKKAPSADDRMVRELALSLEQRLSLPVQIKGLKRGKLVIHYEHFQDLERLITKLVS